MADRLPEGVLDDLADRLTICKDDKAIKMVASDQGVRAPPNAKERPKRRSLCVVYVQRSTGRATSGWTFHIHLIQVTADARATGAPNERLHRKSRPCIYIYICIERTPIIVAQRCVPDKCAIMARWTDLIAGKPAV